MRTPDGLYSALSFFSMHETMRCVRNNSESSVQPPVITWGPVLPPLPKMSKWYIKNHLQKSECLVRIALLDDLAV
jgi:hypothetical protein